MLSKYTKYCHLLLRQGKRMSYCTTSQCVWAASITVFAVVVAAPSFHNQQIIQYGPTVHTYKYCTVFGMAV